jgi:hypothetical protein
MNDMSAEPSMMYSVGITKLAIQTSYLKWERVKKHLIFEMEESTNDKAQE